MIQETLYSSRVIVALFLPAACLCAVKHSQTSLGWSLWLLGHLIPTCSKIELPFLLYNYYMHCMISISTHAEQWKLTVWSFNSSSSLQPPTCRNDLLKCQILAPIFVSLTVCSLGPTAMLTSIGLSGGRHERFQLKLPGSPDIHDLVAYNHHFDRIWETKLQVAHQQWTFCTKTLPADLVYYSYNWMTLLISRLQLDAAPPVVHIGGRSLSGKS